jgi:hypothetical protein
MGSEWLREGVTTDGPIDMDKFGFCSRGPATPDYDGDRTAEGGSEVGELEPRISRLARIDSTMA